MILRGAGRCFSAGHDLSDISTGERLPAPPHFQSKIIERLADLPQPVITAVHSPLLYTGALELRLLAARHRACSALSGDIIVAWPSAPVSPTPTPKWALTPVWGEEPAAAAPGRDLQEGAQR